jgi:hypothetical protein
LSIVFFVENSTSEESSLGANISILTIQNRECGRAIATQMRKVGFARHSRHSRPDSPPSLPAP